MKPIRRLASHIKDASFHTDPVTASIGDVNEANVEKVVEALFTAQSTGQPVFPVYINSYGGEAYTVISLADEFDHAAKNGLMIATIAAGKAMSAGAFLLGVGTPGYRWAQPNATIMLHEASQWFGGKLSEIKTNARELERLNTLLWTRLAEHCGQDEEYFLKLISDNRHQDLHFTPEEALEHGLIDYIGCPRLSVQIEASFAFGELF